ncbi:MAG: hypothetical protein KGI51_03625 [Rhodospirillales bacterium]|nr:hypothetical protein [Rhodospirillales bacterium]
MLFGAVALLSFLALAAIGFVMFAGQPLSLAGLQASVLVKADLKPPGYSLLIAVARLLFSTVNNIAAAPLLAPVGRALILGWIPSAHPYYPALAEQMLPWLVTLALVALTYLSALRAGLRGAACLMPIAFLCGAQAWTIYYGLDDPEHWFQLTAPTLILFLTVVPDAAVTSLLPVWTVLAAAANLAFIALPVATYPLARYETELRREIAPRDLVINFAAFSGQAQGAMFALPGIARFEPDLALRTAPNPAAMLAVMRAAIDACFPRGGRVIVFDLLDRTDWNAPWPALYRAGITKPALRAFFTTNFALRRLPDFGGLKMWQVGPRKLAGQTPPPAAPPAPAPTRPAPAPP